MIRALDTNVIVRIVADRSSPQFPIAVRALDEPFLIPVTVLLEAEWVLRSVYRWPRARIAAIFRDLMDLPELVVLPPAILWILDRYEVGADFGDMVHLTASGGASSFATFDADLARLAGSNAPIPVETLA